MTGAVVVTGAAGFIGRWVVAELLGRGHEVVGVDDLSAGSRRNLDEFASNPDFTFVEADVCDQSAIDSLVDDHVSTVFHLAAKIDVQESLDHPDLHFNTNVVGTYNVLEACRRTDTRLVLVGTCMVYDLADSPQGIGETHPTKPASPYAGSKLAAEDLAESYYRGYELPVTVLRPFNTYGPYQRSDTAGGVVSIFVDRDLRGEPLEIFGDGTQTRDLMYVTDCAEFIVDAGSDDTAIGEVINAGTGRDVSVNELADIVATEGTVVEHVEHHHPQSEVPVLRCDPSKASELLGWEPKTELEEGVRRLREWMERNEQ